MNSKAAGLISPFFRTPMGKLDLIPVVMTPEEARYSKQVLHRIVLNEHESSRAITMVCASETVCLAVAA